MALEQEPFHSTDFEVVEGDWEHVRLTSDAMALPQPDATNDLRPWADERRYFEASVYKQFAVLLAVFGATLAGVITVKNPLPCLLLLMLSCIAGWVLTKSIHRSYAKACFLASALIAYRYPPLHVMAHYFGRKSSRFKGVESFSLVGRRGPNCLLCFTVAATLWAALGALFPSLWPQTARAPVRVMDKDARRPATPLSVSPTPSPSSAEGAKARDAEQPALRGDLPSPQPSTNRPKRLRKVPWRAS